MLTVIVLPHHGIRSQRLHLIFTQSHVIYTDTGQSGMTILTLKIRVQSVEQVIPFLTTLVCCGPGSNLVSTELGADTLPTAILRWYKTKMCYMH